MQEQLLHFIWQRKLFKDDHLFTTAHQPVEIIHPGFLNHDQGPDFLQARIRIADQLWAGHVEIHVNSSDWYLHTHDHDSHYINVILHVVWHEDLPVRTQEGFVIPCLELHDRVDADLLMRYTHLMNNAEWIPCASSIGNVDDLIKTSWLERLMAERLELKTQNIRKVLERCGHDFEQTFFVLLCRQLGAPANSDAMENLGYKIPLQILRKHGNRIDQIESILFGVAGMLTKDLPNDYAHALYNEFNFLKKKYNLTVIPSLQWKFMRMRPAHFPTVRIAQLSVIISKTLHFIDLLNQFKSTAEWINFFIVKPHHEFWDTHYHFKSESPYSEKRMGIETAISLLINLVMPFMFFYGKEQGVLHLKDRALQMMAELPAEKNAIIKGWSKCGWHAQDAGQTQGMIHLKKYYCDVRRCLHCAAGLQLLKQNE